MQNSNDEKILFPANLHHNNFLKPPSSHPDDQKGTNNKAGHDFQCLEKVHSVEEAHSIVECERVQIQTGLPEIHYKGVF